MGEISAKAWLTVAVLLFVTGMAGFIMRRNLIVIFLAVELMLNGAALAILTFARLWGDAGGQVLFFLVLALAAAESAVGLAMVIAVFRLKHRLDADELAALRG